MTIHFFSPALARAVATVLACAVLSACTTVRHISSPNPASGSSAVQIGDKITCTLQDGTKREFVVTACDATLLRGEGEIVAWSDLTELEVSRFSPGKTTAAVLIGAAAVAGGLKMMVSEARGFGSYPSWSLPPK